MLQDTPVIKVLGAIMHPSILAVVFLTWLLTLCVTADTVAQDRYRISSPSCETCRIELLHVVTLGSPSDSFGPARGSKVVATSKGHYLVGPVPDEGRVLVYDSVGSFVTVIGRPGSGPRELGRVRHMALDRLDTLHVFHQGRHTVYSPEYDFVRTSRFPRSVGDVELLGDDRYLITADVAAAASVGKPLHIVAGDSIVSSFGFLPGGEGSFERGLEFARKLALSTDSVVWVTSYSRYRAEQWGIEGVLRRVVERDVSWFPPWRYGGLQRSGRYAPKMGPVHEDPDGMLWVVALATKPGFRPPREDRSREQPVNRYSIDELLGANEAMIEVIDPRNGTLLVSRCLDEMVTDITPNGLARAIAYGPSGDIVLRLYRLLLLR